MNFMNSIQGANTSFGGGSLFQPFKAVVSSLFPVLGLLTGHFGALKRATAGYATLLGVVTGAMVKATGTIRELGNSLTDLRGMNGLSNRQAGALMSTFGAVGIGAGQTSAMFGGMSQAEMRVRANMFGASSFSDLPTIAASYQRTNPQLRAAMLGDANTPEMRRALMQDPNALRQQMGFSNRVQGGMGINQGAIERTAQQLDLVSAKFKTLGTSILSRLGQEALPRIINLFDRLADGLASKSDAIGAAIAKGVEVGFKALLNVGEWIAKVPNLFFALGDSVLSFARVGVTLIPVVFETFLDGISLIQNGLGSLSGIAGNAFTSLMGISSGLGESFLDLVDKMQFAAQNIQGPFAALSDGITNFLSAIYNHPMVQRIIRSIPAAKAVGKALTAIPEYTENALNDGGISPEWSAAGGLGAGALAGYGIRSLFFGGARRGGARAGAGLLRRGARWAAMTPIGRSITAGVALGGLGYNALYNNAREGLGKFGHDNLPYASTEAAPLWEAAQNAGGRLWAGLTTGNIYNYDDRVNQRWAREAQAKAAAAKGGGDDPDAPSTAGKHMADSYNTFMKNMGSAPHGSWRRNIQNAPSMFGNMAAGAWNDFSNTPHSSWAASLDNKVGGAAGLTARATSLIADAQARLDSAKGAYDSDEAIKLMRDSLGEQKQTNQLLKESNLDAKKKGASYDRVRSSMMLSYAMESGAALRMTGNS